MKNRRETTDHQAAIVDQFSRQAVPFSQQQAHSKESFLNLLLEMSGVGPEDNVLDVACGPGLVACAFAARAKHVTGIDLTPAMIARAQEIQREQGLTNLTWQIGNVLPLPFPDGRLFPGGDPLYLPSFPRPPGGVRRNGPGLPPGRPGPGGRYRHGAGKAGLLRRGGEAARPLPHPDPDAGGVSADGRGT